MNVLAVLLLVGTTVTQGLALMCLQCVNVLQPRHCNAITYCAENEVCYVERVASSDGYRYNSGCMQQNICMRQNSSSSINAFRDGLIQSITCTECCQSDLCNSQGCGQPGFPATRGPMCLGCSQTRNATDCRTIVHCRESEVCHITEVVEFGDIIYSTGCVHSQLCSSFVSRPFSISELSKWHNSTGAQSLSQTKQPPTQTQPALQSTAMSTPSMSAKTASTRVHTRPTKDPSTRVHTHPTKHPAPTNAQIGVVVVGKRSAQRRFVDCSQCCYGDLCNHDCSKASTTSRVSHSTYSFPPSRTTQQYATSSPQSSIPNSTPQYTLPHISTTRTSTTLPTQHMSNLPDTSGDEFLLAFSKHENGNDADNITLLVTSSENGHISIYLPINNAYINTTLTKGENVIEIDPHITLNSLQKENKSVHIVTDVNVTLQVQEYRNVFDTGFLALPTQCLSTKYIVSTESAFDGANPSYVTVAALKDNTEVSFRFNLSGNDTIQYKGKSYGKHDTLNITLNRYETFQLAGITDFTGTVVQSSQPISVLSGNTATVIPKPVDPSSIFDAQTLSQMIPPARILGKNFIIPELLGRHSYYYKIIASYPNTRVTVGGKTAILQSEGSFQIHESVDGRSIGVSSDKPVLVVQIAKTMQSHYDTASGAMIVTPAVEQFKSEYAVIVPDPPQRNLQTNYKSYISIITELDQVDNVRIDGSKYDVYNSNLQTVHLNGKLYSVITLPMDKPGLHRVTSVSGYPFGLITYGFDFAQGYGYPIGLKC